MDDSTTAAASSAVDAWWSGSGVAGTRLCGAQIQPVPARESRLALTIRIKRSFGFQLARQWHKVSSLRLQPRQAYFTPLEARLLKPSPTLRSISPLLMSSTVVRIGGSVSAQPTTLQTFAQYRLSFQVAESCLNLKSNCFNLSASRLLHKFGLCQLCAVIALTMLFLVWQKTQVVASGKQRGMSYLKLGWNWLRLPLTCH